MSHNVEYLWVSFFLYWNSHNQHTVNLQICTTFHQLASLALSGFIFVASWLLTEAHGKENHSPTVPSKTRRADHLPLRPTVLPCLMFWKFMELEICQEEPVFSSSCAGLCLLLQCWITSLCLVHHRLAAVALLVLEDEESAFWCLVHIVENLMPADYYSDTLITSQVSWAPLHQLELWYSDLQ